MLNQNNLGDTGVRIIGQLLERDYMQIVHLDLGCNRISPNGFSSLFKSLENNMYLTSLNIGNTDSHFKNKIGKEGTMSLRRLIERQGKNDGALSYLELPNITLGNSGLYGIARGISSNLKIRKLNLS